MSILVPVYYINAYDILGVSESTTTFPPKLNLSVYDGIGASESQTPRNPFYIASGFDQATIQDVVAMLTKDYRIAVSETVSISEYNNQNIPSTALYDTNSGDILGLTESIIVQIQKLNINISEVFTVSENNQITGLMPMINLGDIFGLLEGTVVFIPKYHPDLSDTLRVSESVELLTNPYRIEHTDLLALSEYVRVSIPTGAGATVYYMIWHSPNGPVILVS